MPPQNFHNLPNTSKKVPRFGHQSHRNVWWSDVAHHTNASDQSPLTPRVVSTLPSSWDSQANDQGREDPGISIESKIACHLRFHQNLQKCAKSNASPERKRKRKRKPPTKHNNKRQATSTHMIFWLNHCLASQKVYEATSTKGCHYTMVYLQYSFGAEWWSFVPREIHGASCNFVILGILYPSRQEFISAMLDN